MPDSILHKYFDLGDRALANVSLPSGDRVLLTILPAGFAVHRLHFFGVIPGTCLFGANKPAYEQMTTVLLRDVSMLPPLPRAKGQHKDEHPSGRPLSLFTRLTLSARDVDDLVRLFDRARNTVG